MFSDALARPQDAAGLTPGKDENAASASLGVPRA